MIPAPFTYRRPAGLAELLDLLAAERDRVTLLAGGQSLLPALKARSVRADLVVDIGGLAELAYVRAEGGQLAVGATTRHRELAEDPVVAARLPLLRAAAAEIADPQIRHQGTIGGSLAHADPAADLAAAGIALDASVVLAGGSGRRTVALRDFALGPGRTVRRPTELVVEVRFPVPPEGTPWSYQKFHRDALQWTVAGVAALGGDRPAVALSGLAPTVRRAAAVEAALASGAGAAEAAALVGRDVDPADDVHASAEYRRHLAQVLVRRALTEIGVRP